MLLESIKLTNFRQFKNGVINFAQGEDGKNVTLIIGENGSGKSTFSQAFFWCLYGETAFADKIMLNRIVATELTQNQHETVIVELILKHGEYEYKLVREQIYTKTQRNVVKGDNTLFSIKQKDKTGNTTPLSKKQCENVIKTILPKEFSRFFFFDGDRIEKMSKEISTGKKSTDFADAVRGLLGLNGLINALEHLNPTKKAKKNGVIGNYESSFNTKDNQEIGEYVKIIEECDEQIYKLESQIDNLNDQIESARNRITEKENEIEQYKEVQDLKQQKSKYQADIQTAKDKISVAQKDMCTIFKSSMNTFFTLSLIKRALNTLQKSNNNADLTGKEIPYIHAQTIDFLIEQGICICGEKLEKNSDHYKKMIELKKYLPPNSISWAVSEFKKDVVRHVKNPINLTLDLINKMESISIEQDIIDNCKDEIQKINHKMVSGDVNKKIQEINEEIKKCKEILNKSEDEKSQCDREIGKLNQNKEQAENKRKELSMRDEKNKMIEVYKAYAEKIYAELLEFYRTKEADIRHKLQETINNIFKQIYEGGLSLTIDSHYHITVYADNYDGNVETSTAQSISVIFAFITGIIKLVRENQSSTDEESQLLESEAYPLVMDAPLDAFDKRRIKTICEALPKIAEQIVIFIKDTDGDLAENYLGDKIGSKHRFDKKNEFETVLI